MEYKLQRSKRKTLTVTIHGGEVIVKAPKSMSVAHIENFIAQKSAWIQKKQDEYNKKTSFFSSVIDGTSIMYHGAICPIQPSETHKRIAIIDGTLKLPQKYGQGETAARAIAAWYKRIARTELADALAEVSSRIGLKYQTFATTNAKSKWGSCDGKCNIRLNWRLVMLDRELMLYVIVHELAHTVHHDHSAAFWAEVGRYMPDYAAVRKRLKTYSILTSLYR